MCAFPKTAAFVRKVLPIHRLRERLDYATAAAETRGCFVDLPLGRCHIVEAGTGAPVVLIHGFLLSTLMWEPIMPGLAKHFRPIAVDLMGWGFSARDETRAYDYALYAEQIIQLLDALGIEKASLVGQSMGGATAIRVAAHHPERVDRLVLVDAASLPNPTPFAGRIFALPLVGELLLTAGGNAVIAKNLRDLWFHRAANVTPEYVERVARPLRIRGSSWTALSILRTLDFGSQTVEVERLAAHRIPTLVVWGREDRAIPLAVGESLHAMLGGSEMFVIDGAGHTPHEEEPEQFLARVVPFLLAGAF